MARTDHLEADDRTLTPAESLALIESTLRDTRHALGVSDWPFYLIWGSAWAVAFTFAHLVDGGDGAPLADVPEGSVGLVWLVCVGIATVVTGLVIRRYARGVAGSTARVGRRLGLCWFVAFSGAGVLAGLLELGDPGFGALFVFVTALLYLGQGSAFLDDVQLGAGVWVLVVDVVALAAGPEWFNLLLAVFGAGGMFVAAALAHRAQHRTASDDG